MDDRRFLAPKVRWVPALRIEFSEPTRPPGTLTPGKIDPCTGHHVEHRIDDAPRGVAADGPEQRRPSSVLTATAQNAGSKSEGQDHNQSRDDLSQTLARLEIAQRRHDRFFPL